MPESQSRPGVVNRLSICHCTRTAEQYQGGAFHTPPPYVASSFYQPTNHIVFVRGSRGTGVEWQQAAIRHRTCNFAEGKRDYLSVRNASKICITGASLKRATWMDRQVTKAHLVAYAHHLHFLLPVVDPQFGSPGTPLHILGFVIRGSRPLDCSSCAERAEARALPGVAARMAVDHWMEA